MVPAGRRCGGLQLPITFVEQALAARSSPTMKRQRRTNQYDRPHTIYTLADPRTRAIRYVGRTTRDLREYLRRRVRDAREGSREPVDRWICRLRRQGLEPILEIREQNVRHDREIDVCEELVRHGAALLNVQPSAARFSGRIVVDVEQDGDEWRGEVVHLRLAVKAKDKFEVRHKAAIAALRRLVELLENRGPQYEQELAVGVLGKLFDWRVGGKRERGLWAGLAASL